MTISKSKYITCVYIFEVLKQYYITTISNKQVNCDIIALCYIGTT